VNTPGFAAEASLYKTGQAYRGYNGMANGAAARGVVAQQLDCQGSCALQYGACLLTTGGIAAIVCYGLFVYCMINCPQPGGGGPPPPPECCPPGSRCCGECVVLPNGGEVCRNGKCVRSNQGCP
jgi:hypothetical protein